MLILKTKYKLTHCVPNPKESHFQCTIFLSSADIVIGCRCAFTNMFIGNSCVKEIHISAQPKSNEQGNHRSKIETRNEHFQN